MCSTSEYVQYKSDTSSFQASMCSTNRTYLHFKRGCAVRIGHIFISSKDVKYESGASSVQARMCSKSKVDHQAMVLGVTSQKYFLVNESFLLITYQVKMVNSLWQDAKTLASPELPKKKEGKERKEPEALPHNLSRSGHKLPFSDNNYWLIPLISGQAGFRSENFKSTFAIFFFIFLNVSNVLYDR